MVFLLYWGMRGGKDLFGSVIRFISFSLMNPAPLACKWNYTTETAVNVS